jgi:hypothetical protein
MHFSGQKATRVILSTQPVPLENEQVIDIIAVFFYSIGYGMEKSTVHCPAG